MSGRIALVLVSILVTTGCRSGSNNPDGGPGIDGTPKEMSIQSLQSEDIPVGAEVTLRGVVVTAVDTFGDRTGGLYVMEPEGGPFSGVYVYLSGAAAAGLNPGDLVDIENGVKDEFALQTDETGRTLTEVSPPSGGEIRIVKVGTGNVPAPAVLNPWDLAASDEEAEKWEGVLIKFNNVSMLEDPRNVSSSDDTLKEARITGPFRVSSSLASLDSVSQGDCLVSITGIGDYFFNYKLLPRSAADIETGGTLCPDPEEGDVLCMDNMDNDYDGFADCADFSCQDTVDACFTSHTVVELQDGTVAFGTAVKTQGVVTAISNQRRHLWIQDVGSNAQHNGLYLYRGSNPAQLPPSIAVGSQIEVQGTLVEFNGITELTQVSITELGMTAPVTEIPGATVADLPDLTTGAPWESTLITLNNLEVTDPMSDNFGRFKLSSGGNDIYVDDPIFHFNAQMGQCFSSITAIVVYNSFDSRYELAPRRSLDIMLGNTCP